MTIILAKIFGLYFVSFGLACAMNPDQIRKMYQELSSNKNALMFGGILALLFGAIIISIHNKWELGWSLIVTIIGWWSLIKGFLLISHPEFIKYFSFLQNRSNLFYRGLSLVWIVIGLFLIYVGWM